MPFDVSRLRRFPDVEAPNLQAWDATDELLVREGLNAGIPGDRTVVIGDGYGAITLALADAGMHGIRVHQDLVTGRRALVRNAVALGLVPGSEPEPQERRVAARHAGEAVGAPTEGTDAGPFASHELGPDLLAGARLVLLQLPKGLDELAEIADAVARWAEPDVVLIAGGRVKHMTLAQNEVLSRHFAAVQAHRGERKSRLITASGALPVPADPPFPVTRTRDGLTLCAFGGVFAGARVDIGTRVLLDAVPDMPARGRVVDLGCGTGVLAAAFALRHPDAVLVATDRSAAAVRSARATMAANGLTARVTVTLDDAGSALPGASVDLVLLNPPFHLGTSVHSRAGERLILAAARLLRPGGEVWTVFNSHLDHRRALSRHVGPTKQVSRTPKFTVTRSVRRG
ncbi:class I SAM-dependent methyltransferase [Microbacterium soli]|uniref:Methyltransferase n=1 Tax=Microbacterium soli TaxID=446075 RepID=A0ABP7N0N3_9MICO